MFINRENSKRRQRQFLLVCVAILAIAFVDGIWLYIDKFEEQLNFDTNLRLEETAHYAADHIVTVINETQKKLRVTASALSILDSESQKLLYMREVAAEAGFVYLGYAGADGMLHATIRSESVDISKEKYFISAMQGKDAISDYIRKIFTNRAARGILLAVPIFNPGPKSVTRGVLVAMLDASHMRDALNLQSFNGEGYAYIVNREGMVIMRTRSLDFDNIFLAWAKRKFANGYSLENFRDSVMEGQDGMTIFANASGIRQFVYHYALPFNHWTLINMVSEEAVAGAHMALMKELSIYGGLMALAVLMLIAYTVYSYWSAYRSKIAAQTKSNFLSSMSHEIRTPLNGIIGLNFLMRSNVDDRDKMLTYLDQSQTTAQYLLSLINDILDINKLDADRMELIVAPFNLNKLVDNIEVVFSSTMQSRGITFIINRNITHPYILGDEVRLKQILTNIIGNASKFTPHGGSVTFSTVEGEIKNNLISTRFEIIDTGCGMSKEFQKRIFDAFSQERNVTTGSQGTGLGMAISHQLAKKMGGNLSVESETGHGSTFILELKFEVASESIQEPMQEDVHQKIDTHNSEAESQETQVLSILVAEDNELNRDLLQEILEMHGMKVRVAEDGQEAIEIFASSTPNEFDVILMDMNMPRLDGVEATKRIRKLNRNDAVNIPIYACTANSFEEDRERCMAAGMTGFLAKPVDFPQMLALLNKYREEHNSIN